MLLSLLNLAYNTSEQAHMLLIANTGTSAGSGENIGGPKEIITLMNN